ncbi:MAG: metallophosphoesterase family protein [Kiritimatiellae bacterium]|nr:metallophosphoesterase family protein [Kiritimatiellia bacterium]
MKYAIMSDVHANPVALETALADARALGCEKFAMLGDVTGYGYDPKRALSLVRENFDIVLMGNHDSACLGLEQRQCDLDNPNYDLDRKCRGELSDDDAKWLRGLRPLRKVAGMALAHGDFTEPKEWNYINEPALAAANFGARREKLLFCGHTHHAEVWSLSRENVISRPSDGRLKGAPNAPETIEFKREKGARYIVNVGSVGYPRHDLCMSYAICDPSSGVFAIRRLPFDFKSYVMSMVSHGIDLPAWLLFLLATASR